MSSALRGKRILVTRPEAQADGLCEQLSASGAHPVRFPTIRLEPMADIRPLQRVLERLSSFDWVIFTSVNGVTHTWQALTGAWSQAVKVAAIGPATANALQMRGVTPDFVPEEFRAECIAKDLEAVGGNAVLLLRAESARPILAEMLRERNANVTEVAVYRTLVNRPPATAYAALDKGVDAITFTSSSTVEGYTAVIGRAPRNSLVACIGPVTAQTARTHGFRVAAVAREYTTGGLVQALLEYFATS